MVLPDVGGYKYLIKLKFNVEGIVEKPDVIGAIFGQTEGLFGPELDLNELQKNWKIGRIELHLHKSNSKTMGEVYIPSNTDIAAAALIAAAIETIDKVGPYPAKFRLEEIQDVRATRRRQIIERAKEILREWSSKAVSEGEDALKELYGTLKPIARLTTYGPENLPAGPGVQRSDTLILVEGRADVINMLRAGYDNVIAIEGAKVPDSVVQLAKSKKRVVAFLDGDRGGDLILKELKNKVRLTKVYRAPPNKEVEELTPEEIRKILSDLDREIRIPDELASRLPNVISELKGTLEGVLLNEKGEVVNRVPVSKLYQTLQDSDNIYCVVFDGIITQRVLDVASEKGVNLLVGLKKADELRIPSNVEVMTFNEVEETTAEGGGKVDIKAH